jgi:hypothetical protein
MLVTIAFVMSVAWASFLFYTHRAAHTTDWFPIAVLIMLAVIVLRKNKRDGTLRN